MKAVLLFAAVFGLVSCNTSIGLWRDTKAVTKWSVRKVQEASNNNYSSYDEEYGAPVY